MQKLETVAQVIDALGGPTAVKNMTGVKSYQVVWEWRKRDCFPSKFFVLMTHALRQINSFAPPQLWQMIVADDCTIAAIEGFAPNHCHWQTIQFPLCKTKAHRR